MPTEHSLTLATDNKGKRLEIFKSSIEASWGRVVQPEYDAAFDKQIGNSLKRGVTALDVRRAIAAIDAEQRLCADEKAVKDAIFRCCQNSAKGSCGNSVEVHMLLLWNVAKDFPTAVTLDFFEQRKRSPHATFWPMPADLERHCTLWQDDVEGKLSFLRRKLSMIEKPAKAETKREQSGTSFTNGSGKTVQISQAVRDRIEAMKREKALASARP